MRLPYKLWKNMNDDNKQKPELLLNGRLRYLKKNALEVYKSKVKKNTDISKKIKLAERIHMKQLEGKIEKSTKTKTNIKVNKKIRKRAHSSFPKNAKVIVCKPSKKDPRKTWINKGNKSSKKTKKNYVVGSSEYKFYMSLLCQKPNSPMAKSWINKHGILNKEIEKYCKILSKKSKLN